MLQAIAGYDPLDINSINTVPPDFVKGMARKVSSLRIGIPRAVFYESLHPDIEHAVTDALGVLRGLTATTSDVELPPYKTLPVVPAEAYAYHAPYFTKTPELYQPMTQRRLEGGKTISTTAYIEGRRELERLRRAVSDVFATVDVLVTPTSPVMPPTVAEAVADPGTPPPGGVAPSLRNTQPFDIYGLPSISIPCGFSRDGMPIGLEISGPRLGEPVVLAIAQAYERATDWHKRTPEVK